MTIKKVMYHDQEIATNVSNTSDLNNDSGFITLSDIPAAFSVTNESFSYPAISSGNGSGVRTETFSKSGYYPIGVVGFRAGNSHAVVARFNLTSRSSGSCELSYYLRAVGGNVSAGSGDVDILWVKE